MCYGVALCGFERGREGRPEHEVEAGREEDAAQRIRLPRIDLDRRNVGLGSLITLDRHDPRLAIVLDHEPTEESLLTKSPSRHANSLSE